MEIVTIHANSMSADLMKDITTSTMNISLPGHDDVPLTFDYNLPNLSNYLIEKIGDKEVILIGNSIGALLSHQIADKVNVKGIISIAMPPMNYDLIEGAILENECTALAYNEDLTDEEMRSYARTITKDSKAYKKIYEFVKTANPKVRSGLMASVGAGELRDEVEILSQLDIPILFIQCNDDVIVNSEKFDNISFGEVLKVDAGHLFPVENPEELNQIISGFLSKHF
jgi:pimeloyl-ACP methyl ester carboxylesterase